MRLTRILCCAALTCVPALGAQSHRAILVSFDGFSEPWLRKYSDSATTPHLWQMFAQSTCAETVRPAFPSVTPVSHAAIWTGAYANITGISASSNGKLPWPATTVLESTDGYKATALRAEPIWIAAARQGKAVFSHMATQSPQPPAYMPVDRSTPALDSARARAARTMQQPNIGAVNIYNDLVANTRVIRSASEMDWAFGDAGDSLHARIRDDSTVVVWLNRASTQAVAVRLAATETASPRGRPLARFFSEPLPVTLPDGRRTFVYFRLWELSRDRSRMLLFVSEARVMQANRPQLAAAYDDAVRGVLGNGGSRPLERGELGVRAPNGGDGSAELRYLETVELVTRQYMKGTEWAWSTSHPELLVDYLPYPDEVLHTFLGFAEPSTPGVSAEGRENAARMIRRGYELVDVRVEQLQRLAASAPNTRLFVTGEHGMRPSWKAFRPNVVLRDAGLLALTPSGQIDLSRSKAVTGPGGWWISVNRTTRKDGIVPADSVNAVLERAERALLAARDADGKPIVTRIFRAGTIEGDSLGIGGPGGGDLYYGLAPGYYWGPATTAPATVPMNFPMGEHGYPSIDRDMQPLLCISGGWSQRIGEVRSIDIAPSVAAWLGINPPADSRGRSLMAR